MLRQVLTDLFAAELIISQHLGRYKKFDHAVLFKPSRP